MSDWIEWEGGDCPLPYGTPHMVRFRDGEECFDDSPQTWGWGQNGDEGEIVAYRVTGPAPITLADVTAQRDKLLAALTGLLKRDERNTCQHDETYRGGAIWEICRSCGAKWADDEGGMPEWKAPPEWGAAYQAIAECERK